MEFAFRFAKASGVSIRPPRFDLHQDLVLMRGDSRSAVMVLQQTLNCWQRCLMNSFC